MCSIPARLPLPPKNKLNRSTLTASKPSSLIGRPSSLITKPMKGSIQPSASQGKIVPLSTQILQKRTQSNRSPSVGVNHSSSTSKLFSEFTSEKALAHEIRIRVFSNYGHPSLISCSEIDIINEKRQTTPISSITIEPKRNAANDMLINSSKRRSLTKSRSESNLNLYDFSKLTNGTVMEKDESQYWHAEWPPEFPLKFIDIVIIVKTPYQIDSLRIWPNKIDQTKNFKHISIFLDQNLLYDNELENEFGLVIPLQKFDSLGNSRVIGSRELTNRVSDSFGILPVKATTSIEIGFLQAYDSKYFFGLQQIKIYDSQGESIDLISKGMIECFNCGDKPEKEVNSIFTIDEPDINFKWIGQLNKDSRIVIKFIEATIISAVALVTLPENIEQSSLSIKQIKIKCNGVNVWCGAINRGDYESKHARDRTSIIFLYDSSTIKEKILRDIYKNFF